MSEYLYLQPRDFVSRSESSEMVRRSESELVSTCFTSIQTSLMTFIASSRDSLAPVASIMQMCNARTRTNLMLC